MDNAILRFHEMNDAVNRLILSLNEAKRDRDEAIELLKQCEFASNSGTEYSPACPVCEGHIFHTEGCRLQRFLDTANAGIERPMKPHKEDGNV